MQKIQDHMAIEYEIASIKFRQRGLTTDGMEWKQLQQEIFNLQHQRHVLSLQSQYK
jgi:hypothetical protein